MYYYPILNPIFLHLLKHNIIYSILVILVIKKKKKYVSTRQQNNYYTIGIS